MSILPLSKEPQPDEAELNAFFPSPFSLKQFTKPMSGVEGANYPQPYRGMRRILVICTDERYLKPGTVRCSRPATTRSRRWCRCTICTRPGSGSTSPPFPAIR